MATPLHGPCATSRKMRWRTPPSARRSSSRSWRKGQSAYSIAALGCQNLSANIYLIDSGGVTAAAAAMPVWVSRLSRALSKCMVPASSSKIARAAAQCSPSAFQQCYPKHQRREQNLRPYAELRLSPALETGRPAAFLVADSLDGCDAIRHHP